MQVERSAGAIVFRRAKKGIVYLLLQAKYKTEYRDFPKGLIEKGEDLEKAALREVKEETSLENLKLVPGFRRKITYFYKKNGETVYKEVYLFLAEAKSEDVKVSWEHEGFEWVDFETARKLLRKQQMEVLEKANKILEKGLTKWT